MTHSLREDQVALVLTPKDYDNPEEWSGEISMSLAVHKESSIPIEILAHLMNMVTMMSTFLDMANEDPDLYDEVEEYRNERMGIDGSDFFDEEDEEEEKPVVTVDGNVYTLDKWTKTKGNA